MRILKKILDFYINSSIHVALSSSSLVIMSEYMFHIPININVIAFTFFGTIVGYNFVKYDALARIQKIEIRKELKGIIFLSFLSFLTCGYFFLNLHFKTKMYAVFVLLITLLYTLSFFPNNKNARNWVGVKIYIVALCWVGVTLFLPIIDAGVVITTDFFLKCIQRFILVFVLILIFEIIDLANDDPHLQTVPQKIGVKRTKILGLLLLLPFYFLEFFKINFDSNQLIVNLVLVITLSFFILFANQNRSKYYTSFWVEAIPILWLGLFIVLQKC